MTKVQKQYNEGNTASIHMVPEQLDIHRPIVKNLPAMRETQVRSLGQEDPLEKGMATHSNILAWRIPWTEEPGRLYSPWGGKESDTTE